jgi:hypothetical protein
MTWAGLLATELTATGEDVLALDLLGLSTATPSKCSSPSSPLTALAR